MEQLDNLVKITLAEVERIISTKTVVGEPFEIRGNTIVPLVAVGFGFGRREREEQKTPRRRVWRAGAGGGVKPVAPSS